MGVVTWKNIAPSNPAGILSAANQAAQTMGEGFAGIGEAALGYTDDKTQRETDAFISDLMSASSPEQRDSMINVANDAWLNMDLINKTNYELGAPDREQKKFEEQLAISQLSQQDLLDYEYNLKESLENVKGQYKGTSTSGGPNSKKFQDPTTNDPFENKVFPAPQDGKLGFGSGVGPEEQKHYNLATQNFLSSKMPNGNDLIGFVDSGKGDGTVRREISAWHINELAKKRFLTFEDNTSIPWLDEDTFIFNYEGKGYKFDTKMDQETTDAFYELVMKEVVGRETETVTTRNLYWKDFTDNNPGIAQDYGKAYTIFKQKYDDNIKNKKSYTKARSDEIFGKYDASAASSSSSSSSSSANQSKEAKTQEEQLINGKWVMVDLEQPITRKDEFVAKESASYIENQISNDLQGMNREGAQTLYDKIAAKKKAYEDGILSGNQTTSPPTEYELELLKQLSTALNIEILTSTVDSFTE